jgi:hypothetical protein
MYMIYLDKRSILLLQYVTLHLYCCIHNFLNKMVTFVFVIITAAHQQDIQQFRKPQIGNSYESL